MIQLIMVLWLIVFNPTVPTPTPYGDNSCPTGSLGDVANYSRSYVETCGHCFGISPTPTMTRYPTRTPRPGETLDPIVTSTPTGSLQPTSTPIWATTPTPIPVQSTSAPFTTWRFRSWTSSWSITNNVTSEPAYSGTGITLNRIDDAWKSFTWQNFTGTLYIYRWGSCAFTLSYKDAYNTEAVTVRSDLTSQTGSNFSEKIIEISGQNLWISYSTSNTCGSGSGGDVKTSTGHNLITPTPSTQNTPEPVHCYYQEVEDVYDPIIPENDQSDLISVDGIQGLYSTFKSSDGWNNSMRFAFTMAKVKRLYFYDLTYPYQVCVKGREALGWTDEYCLAGYPFNHANLYIEFPEYLKVNEFSIYGGVGLPEDTITPLWLDGLKLYACSDDKAYCANPVEKLDLTGRIIWGDPICRTVFQTLELPEGFQFISPLADWRIPGLQVCDVNITLPFFSTNLGAWIASLLAIAVNVWNFRIVLGLVRSLADMREPVQDSRSTRDKIMTAVKREEELMRVERAKKHYDKRKGG